MIEEPFASDNPLSQAMRADAARAKRRRRLVGLVLTGLAALALLISSGQVADNPVARILGAGGGDRGATETAPLDPNEPEAALVVVARNDLRSIVVRSGAESSAPAVAELANDPAAPLHFLSVLDFDSYAASGQAAWIQVLLPIRPNGSTGWLQRSDVLLLENPFRIEIDVSEFRLTVFERNQVFEESTIAVGTGDTPTPIGRFFTTVLYKVPTENSAYGPYAFGLSGFSEILLSFNGGEGVVGIHGTNDPASLGTEISHGCIRLPNEVIEKLAEILPLGTPVVIVE